MFSQCCNISLAIRNSLDRLCKTDCKCNGFCAAAAVALLRAAMQERFPGRAAFDIECANAFRPVNFMRGNRQEVNTQCLHINGYFAKCLHSIGMNERFRIFLYFVRNSCNGIYCTRFIIDHHQRNKRGIVSNEIAVPLNMAKRTNWDECDNCSERCDPFDGFENGMMLGGTGEHF